MRTIFHSILLIFLPGLVATAMETEQIDFSHQIVPILKEHCFECHGGDESKGGFSINTRRLFLDGETAEPGDADKSYFLELIEDPDSDFRMPSNGRPPVPEDQVEILKRWVNEGLNWEPGFTFGESAYEPPLLPRLPELPSAVDGRDHPIDRLIDSYLASGGYKRPDPIDDAAFLRRISLDLVGLLPKSEEARAFLADKSPDKRERLIDELLARDIEYTEHWLTFWNDLLRNDYDSPGGRKQISTWLYGSLKVNKPFDAMVRELIAPPDDGSSGFIGGIKWRGTVSAGQSLPIQFSQSVSQSFLGINMKCASCHDSFIDRWTLDEAYGLAAVFSEDPLELYRCDIPTGVMAKAGWPFPEIGQIDPAASKEERLKQLADLFTHPDNGRVPRTIVNRLWGQMMGRGIVHPLDAMGTEPWNADLLDWLAADFQMHGFDLKRTLRLIATSQAYQSHVAISELANDVGEFVYHGPVAKRLTAEQFVDAVWQVSGTAPPGFDAPVARAAARPEMVEALALESSWVWGPSVDGGALPPHGEYILLRREFSPAKPLRSAGIIASADNAYFLYLNGEEILKGTSVNTLQAAPVGYRLKEDNRILIVAENRGPKPNPAGVFCALRLEYADGEVEIIVTDETWKVSDSFPVAEHPGKLKLDALEWEQARVLADTTWKEKTDTRTGKALATALASSDHMVRSSLLKPNALMRSLGRPNREQIVTSRPSELTALEALELSTSGQLIEYLGGGAEKLLQSGVYGDRNALIEEIYLSLLNRYPTRKEVSVLRRTLGRKPDKDRLTDVLWAIVMTPEFFIIH
ncbi:MAG: DUF1549 domain-containing protein [Puniceicoccaceae bacterium]